MILTPFFMYDIVDYVTDNNIDTSSVREIFVAGQAINQFKFRKVVERFAKNVDFVFAYAATETLAMPITMSKDIDFETTKKNHTGKILKFSGLHTKLIDL